MKINLAIFSPNENAYSETFIQSHKNLPFNIKFYFDGYLPIRLAEKPFYSSTIGERFISKIIGKRSSRLSERELSLKKSLIYHKVNCVLAEYGMSAAESLNVIKDLGLPLIVHFHGFDASVHDILSKYKKKYIEVFEYAKAVIVVSRKMFDSVKALGCPEAKLHLIYYGFNKNFSLIKPDFKQKKLVALGRMVDKKAPYFTLYAFKLVLQKHPDAKLILGGNGPLFETCVNLSKLWNIEKSVEFKGSMSPEEVMSEFESATAFVQHSITASNGDSEGTPVAIIEAQAAGLPILATKHAGIPDVVANGRTGYLFEEKDVEAMANYMDILLADSNLCKKLGDEARLNAITNLTMDQYLSKIEKIINSIFIK